ncbi:PREDICTED: uncharacterized protein LOC103329395 isoform X2 [Prunus mume]|uniref:Uncharacterized protein LOC103329395 isoform X2 n=1 Tax=Prunus mume TaxID=102107 RepID=A0ABM0NUM4_PRUMU|nr:PREDICTED: uncharacterized protein LOC103329395 isoform X2 [Prunus mume]
MMEKSRNSSLIKAVPSKQTTYSCTEEESGWTAYFEDFSNNNNNRREGEAAAEEQSLCSSFGCASSLVSDAASGAAWKLASQNNQNQHTCSNSIGGSPNNFPKKLTFKKTRTKKISGDDLEDTASSPVNSPKGKEGEHFAELEQADDHEKTNDCCGKTDSTDLKKRGLCLVPMSLLANYLV